VFHVVTGFCRKVGGCVTSSVLGQGVFDSPSLTLVIGANIF
jgi:hypothetical protein